MTPIQTPTLSPANDASAEAVWIVVMGVAGCGKSTVGRRLADDLRLAFIEGDQFHPPENVRKMSEGIALEDGDRQGWLDRLAAELQSHPQGAVLSCSALKQAYRDRLRQAVPDLRFIHLSVAQDLANARVQARSAQHLFPPSLVASQFAALEDPRGEERVLVLDGALAPSRLSAKVTEWALAPNLQSSSLQKVRMKP
jgi:gluconokinase